MPSIQFYNALTVKPSLKPVCKWYAKHSNVDTYTSIKSLATTLGFCNPLLLDDQNNELDLSIPSGSALSIATFKITNKPTAKAIGSPSHKATKNYKNNNLFIAHW